MAFPIGNIFLYCLCGQLITHDYHGKEGFYAEGF